jgi:hypothetical protein
MPARITLTKCLASAAPRLKPKRSMVMEAGMLPHVEETLRISRSSCSPASGIRFSRLNEGTRSQADPGGPLGLDAFPLPGANASDVNPTPNIVGIIAVAICFPEEFMELGHIGRPAFDRLAGMQSRRACTVACSLRRLSLSASRTRSSANLIRSSISLLIASK